MRSTQEGDRRQAMSYFRYASLVTDELAAGSQSVADALSPVAGAAERERESAGEAADAAGLTTALWRAAHALSPPAAAGEPRVGVAGPYSVNAVRDSLPPESGADHLDRMG